MQLGSAPLPFIQDVEHLSPEQNRSVVPQVGRVVDLLNDNVDRSVAVKFEHLPGELLGFILGHVKALVPGSATQVRCPTNAPDIIDDAL
ncbi:MAG TPA: hypothetical protein VH722_15840, partial [Alphaproteobacteria bacterium]|nr:hypothetical protein [Alphaproteobacteria bacterium]